MAFTTGNSVAWSDVVALYNSLNEVRSRFSLGTTTVPGNPGYTYPSAVSNLKSAIEACRSNRYINEQNTWQTNVTVPSVGDYLQPDVFKAMETTIGNMAKTCAFDSAYFSASFHAFRSFSSNNGFGSNSFDTFHSRASSSNGSFSAANSFST